MTASAAPSVGRPGIASARGLAPAFLMCVGVGLIAFFVTRAGVGQVLGALERSGRWLPLLAALEALLLVTDTAAFATLIASAQAIPVRGWLRSSAASYACLVLLPAGRAAGEAARAVLATPHTGARRASAAGAELQAVALIADGVISLVAACVVYCSLGGAQHLAASLLANCSLVTIAGAALLFLMRSRLAKNWVFEKCPRLARFVPQDADGPRGSAYGATGWSVLGRAIQVLQYGIAMLAVGGAFNIKSAFIADGVHLVGATAGVALPNQVGVADGAYLIFADALGFGSAPGRALGAMLAVRCAQLLLAAVCLTVLVCLRKPVSVASHLG